MTADSALLRQIRAALAGRDDIAAAWLFGSRARGDHTPDSDVDVAILFRERPAPTLLEQPFALEADIATATGLPVQVVVANTAPADLVHRVLRDGILLAEPDPVRRVRFEVYKRNERWDMLPIWNEYRRQA